MNRNKREAAFAVLVSLVGRLPVYVMLIPVEKLCGLFLTLTFVAQLDYGMRGSSIANYPNRTIFFLLSASDLPFEVDFFVGLDLHC